MTFTLSAYRNSYDTKGVDVSLDTVEKWIRTGARGLDKKTQRCHFLLKNAPDGYKNYKENELPAVTFAGTFPRSKRKANFLAGHSSLVVLDVDDLSEPDIPLLLSELSQLKQVILAFVSPSGQGIKIVVSVDPLPANDADHKTAWHACVDFFQSLSDEYGFEIDPSGKDCSRLCYLAHHAQVITHDEVLPIGWDPSKVYLHTSELDDYEHSEADTSSLQAFLKSQDVQILGRRPRGGFFVECLNRAGHTGGKQGKTDSFIRLCENGLIYHCSHHHCNDKKSGWFFEQKNMSRDPFRKTPDRYHIDPTHQYQTSDMDTERDANKNVLTQWLEETERAKGKHLLILGSAAGTGKTTAAITTAETLLYIGRTSEEADQVFSILFDAEEDCYRHRPRLYNRDRDDWDTLPIGLGEEERPCIKPELCNLHAERVGTPGAICARCPVESICQDDGYLSQTTRERKTSKVVYAWDERVACDEIYKVRLKRVMGKDKILIVDEVNPINLTQHRQITRDMLYDLTERFRMPGTAETFQTLKVLLDLISTVDTPEAWLDGLRNWIDTLEDSKALDQQIGQYPVGVVFSQTPDTATHKQPLEATLCYRDKDVTVPVVSHEVGETAACYFISDTAQIELETWHVRFMPYRFLAKVGLATLDDPPPRYQRLLGSLKAFLDENTSTETAAFHFDPKEQRFDYYLKPTLNHRRAIFNTASDTDNLISEAYRDTGVQITRHTGTPPAWKATTQCFQITTGNYLPHHSQIGYGENGKQELKPRAQQLIDDYIVPSIEAGLKVLVVADKRFQETEAVQALDCEVINHHHAEGRNDYQDSDIVFVFHYEPSHNQLPIDAKHIYSTHETPLDFTRAKQTVTQGSVSFEKNTYVDERVQAVYNRECRQRLMQSVMRLRPNINENKIIVFFTSEPVDIPVTPVSFRPTDAQHFAGDWQALRENLQAGETRTVEELQHAGMSKSKAYRDTQAQRTQTKAEMKQLAAKWHSEGVDFTEIANRLSERGAKPVHRTTVARWVEKAKF